MKRILTAVPLVFILSCSSGNWEYLRNKTEDALEKKNYAEALNCLEAALAEDSDNAEIHYYKGQTYRSMLFADGALLNKIDRVYAQKASDEFRRTIELSPKYTGKKFVVDPYSKIQSIWSALAMTFMYENKPDSTRWAFSKGKSEGGFYDALMEYNKNIMASCEKDAILFTNGDNDTFPMWFLQMMENYRTDINVVNLSLLNVPWYIKQQKNSYPTGVNNTAIDLTDAEIDELKPVLWEEKPVEIVLTDYAPEKPQKMEWVVKPTIDEKAVRVQDLMLIQILKTNIEKRPVYFSSTVYGVNKIGMDKYLALEGLVYKVNSYESEINPHKLYSNLSKVYTYDGVKDKHMKYADDVLSLYQNYYNCFLKIASYYLDAGQTDKAKEVIAKMDQVIPEDLVPYTYETLKTEAENIREKL